MNDLLDFMFPERRDRRPTCAQVERLLVLDAASNGGASALELARRLGLSPLHVPALADELRPMVTEGLLEAHDDLFCTSPVGARYLADTRAWLEEQGPR